MEMESDSLEERINSVYDLDKRFKDLLSIYYNDGIYPGTLLRFSLKLFITTAIASGARLDQMKNLLDSAYETLKIGLDSSTGRAPHL